MGLFLKSLEYAIQGTHWLVLYGNNVVRLVGNKTIMINTGTAQVKAFKSNGALLGTYYFEVKR